MTSGLFEDFNERSKEVSKYFLFLKSIESGHVKLRLNSSQGDLVKVKDVDSELVKTLKASGFLLLYNLVEATMRNAIEAIFEDLKSRGVSFDEIRPELKKIVLQNLKKRNADQIYVLITNISVDIIFACFDKDELFSGNVDGRTIKDAATKYGFSYITDPIKTGNGADLLTVKTNRNDLAHGVKSFSEVGREKSADELLEIKHKVVRYLRQILQNIENYINQQEYLASANSDELE